MIILKINIWILLLDGDRPLRRVVIDLFIILKTSLWLPFRLITLGLESEKMVRKVLHSSRHRLICELENVSRGSGDEWLHLLSHFKVAPTQSC